MAKKNSKVTVVADPPVNDPQRAEYTPPEAKSPRLKLRGQDANAEERKEDHVYGIASRARWGGDSDVTQMHRDSRSVDGSPNSGDTEEEEEEEEGTSAADLTVAQLKEALEAAEVEIPANAKKADLVTLYEANNLGEAE